MLSPKSEIIVQRTTPLNPILPLQFRQGHRLCGSKFGFVSMLSSMDPYHWLSSTSPNHTNLLMIEIASVAILIISDLTSYNLNIIRLQPIIDLDRL
ncbi:hypothetical protein GDO81_021540 [Engystomops pustulosus]|uniref:Uncharacterized protein n=1 Tax=Engystomops pustulosus TaxID=76066 RepID=A0AAV6ZLZ1_ENGPU|nr:hypothetical protein GDO81_021540 [Engystomops pustulosus]